MAFEMGFENGERVNVMDVWWEGAPEVGSRAAEGSRSPGGRAGRWYSEVPTGADYPQSLHRLGV